MLRWSAVFLIISLIAGVLGFGNVSAASADIARICFFFFIVVFLITLVMGLVAGKKVSQL